MSDLAFQENGLVVIDNVLTPDNLKSIRLQIVRLDYQSVHAGRWHKVWRLWDGNPQRSETLCFDPDRLLKWGGAAFYPTHTPIDFLVDVIREAANTYPGVVGIDWVGILLTPWIYPVGSALSEHWDSGPYTGAFTFYLHERWGAHWGGDLIVSPGRPVISDDVEAESRLVENGDDDEGGGGVGVCIPSKPNRLVLLGSSRPHRVTRVDQNAGTHARLSVGGFFLPPAK